MLTLKLQIALPQGPNYVDIELHYRKSYIANRPFWHIKKELENCLVSPQSFVLGMFSLSLNKNICKFYVGGHNRFLPLAIFALQTPAPLVDASFTDPLSWQHAQLHGCHTSTQPLLEEAFLQGCREEIEDPLKSF